MPISKPYVDYLPVAQKSRASLYNILNLLIIKLYLKVYSESLS